MKQEQTKTKNEYRDTLTVPEVAEVLRVSVNAIYRMSAKGELPTFRIGKHIRCSRRALDQWIAEQAAKGES